MKWLFGINVCYLEYKNRLNAAFRTHSSANTKNYVIYNLPANLKTFPGINKFHRAVGKGGVLGGAGNPPRLADFAYSENSTSIRK